MPAIDEADRLGEEIDDLTRQAGVGNDFLDDLMKNNSRDQEQKKEAEYDDTIQLIDFSERQFIHFAQEKLVENRKLFNEKSIKAKEHSKRELIEQRVLSEV